MMKITIEATNQTKQTQILKQLQGNYYHSSLMILCVPMGARLARALCRNLCSIKDIVKLPRFK